jgi:hypothetical protein
MILMPEAIDRRFNFSEDSLQTYLRVSWSAPVPSETITVNADVDWVSSQAGSAEVGVCSRALRNGAELATTLLVTRMPGDVGSWGTPGYPSVPDVGTLRRHCSLVVGEAQVRSFADLAGVRNPTHTDIHHAWKRGLANVLVQGHVLALMQLSVARVGAAGLGEMWFRRTVPAGSALEVCRSDQHDDIWAIRLVGGGEIAVVARISPNDFVQPAEAYPVSTAIEPDVKFRELGDS